MGVCLYGKDCGYPRVSKMITDYAMGIVRELPQSHNVKEVDIGGFGDGIASQTIQLGVKRAEEACQTVAKCQFCWLDGWIWMLWLQNCRFQVQHFLVLQILRENVIGYKHFKFQGGGSHTFLVES